MFSEIQKNMTWRAIPIAGVAAGSVFLLVSGLLSLLTPGINVGLLLRYFAALLLGSNVLTSNDATTLVVGIIIHYVLSLGFALMIAIVVHRWGLMVGIIGGALLGLAIYGINLYTMTLFFEWFFATNSIVLLVSHVLFGAVAGGVYELFDHYDLPLVEE
jgi:hypothetical protein